MSEIISVLTTICMQEKTFKIYGRMGLVKGRNSYPETGITVQDALEKLKLRFPGFVWGAGRARFPKFRFLELS